MRRLLAWIAGAAGGIAAWRLATRRHAPALEARVPAPEPPAEGEDPRAEELRAKVEETRAAEPEAAPAEAEDLEERRRRVHEAGRATLDEMEVEE